MAAVIRVKRRVDEDPLNAFVLNCKKRRVDRDEGSPASTSNNAEESSTVLKFAGTFEKADNIPTHLQQRVTKEDAKEAISRVHRPSILSRNRQASRQTTQNSRFRIVNCTRSLDQDNGLGGTTIVDVECATADGSSTPADQSAASTSRQETTEKPATPSSREEEGYVYDLYVADELQQSTHIPYIPDNLEDISVAIHDDPLFYALRNDADADSSSAGEESEDSNDENNWRNDYPDEDEYDDYDGSFDEQEGSVNRAMCCFKLDSENELSSSDDDYFDDRDEGIYGDDVDDDDDDRIRVNRADVENFGTAYAKYKVRLLKGGYDD